MPDSNTFFLSSRSSFAFVNAFFFAGPGEDFAPREKFTFPFEGRQWQRCVRSGYARAAVEVSIMHWHSALTLLESPESLLFPQGSVFFVAFFLRLSSVAMVKQIYQYPHKKFTKLGCRTPTPQKTHRIEKTERRSTSIASDPRLPAVRVFTSRTDTLGNRKRNQLQKEVPLFFQVNNRQPAYPRISEENAKDKEEKKERSHFVQPRALQQVRCRAEFSCLLENSGSEPARRQTSVAIFLYSNPFALQAHVCWPTSLVLLPVLVFFLSFVFSSFYFTAGDQLDLYFLFFLFFFFFLPQALQPLNSRSAQSRSAVNQENIRVEFSCLLPEKLWIGASGDNFQSPSFCTQTQTPSFRQPFLC